MTVRSWTRYDKTYIGLTAGPLILLGALIAIALVSGWQQQRKVDSAWTLALDEIGENVGELTFAKWYDDRTSKDSTADFSITMKATDALMIRLSELDSSSVAYEELVPPDKEWEAAEIVHHYMDQGKPIISKLKRLADLESTPWYPLIFQGFETLLPEVQESRNFVRILDLEFRDAFHHAEHDRAIEALRTMTHLFGPKHKSLCLVEELVRVSGFAAAEKLIRDSLAFDVWTPEQLDALMELVSVKFDWNTRWRDVNQAELLMCYPAINDAGIATPQQVASMYVAPSELSELIRHRHRVATTSGAGTLKHVAKIRDADSDFVNGATDQWRPDRLIQFPLMQGKWLSSMVSPNHEYIAAQIAEESASQHWTRCAIAIKQFEVQFNKFPKRLSELSKIGFKYYEDQSIGPYIYLAPMTKGGPATLEIKTDQVVQYTSRSDEFNTVTIK